MIRTHYTSLYFFRTDSSSCSDDTNQKRKGRLSSRMLIPGNTWQAVWNAAKPVPARRQVFFSTSFCWNSYCWFVSLIDLNFDILSSYFRHAIVVFLQRRLFDDTREAEKVLHFLETRNIGQIVQLTIVPLFHASILRVKVWILIENCVMCVRLTSFFRYYVWKLK